ncbi:hypothetical protein R3P38DRAFT_3125046 [Favolaschia claudopus]|uniref:Uncharacterized protein n=1 Tax=Favolaschia claudopus TaxID=2862362 RepID=A0AAV9ZB75_9AGAR
MDLQRLQARSVVSTLLFSFFIEIHTSFGFGSRLVSSNIIDTSSNSTKTPIPIVQGDQVNASYRYENSWCLCPSPRPFHVVEKSHYKAEFIYSSPPISAEPMRCAAYWENT